MSNTGNRLTYWHVEGLEVLTENWEIRIRMVVSDGEVSAKANNGDCQNGQRLTRQPSRNDQYDIDMGTCEKLEYRS